MSIKILLFRSRFAVYAGCQLMLIGCGHDTRPNVDLQPPILRQVSQAAAEISDPTSEERDLGRSADDAPEVLPTTDISRRADDESGPALASPLHASESAETPLVAPMIPSAAGAAINEVPVWDADEPVSFGDQPAAEGMHPSQLNAPAYGSSSSAADGDADSFQVQNHLSEQLREAAAFDNPDNAHTREPQHALLAAAPHQPSARVMAVAKQAEREIYQGFVLANRGATFSAKNRFLKALRMIAEARDAERGEKYYSAALERGLVAIEEAEDFVLHESQQSAAIDVARCVQAHRTRVLQAAEQQRVTPILALQQYFTYAQEQLGIAGGNVPAASSALHYLGKLYATLDAQSDIELSSELNAPKSMVFHQAALFVDANNYLAAHELGVMLARIGQWEDAKRVTLHGLRTRPQAGTWRNLAIIHRQLGEQDLARLAMQEHELLQRQDAAKPAQSDPVVWLSNDQFARTSRDLPGVSAGQARPQGTARTPPPVSTR